MKTLLTEVCIMHTGPARRVLLSPGPGGAGGAPGTWVGCNLNPHPVRGASAKKRRHRPRVLVEDRVGTLTAEIKACVLCRCVSVAHGGPQTPRPRGPRGDVSFFPYEHLALREQICVLARTSPFPERCLSVCSEGERVPAVSVILTPAWQAVI